jgi:ketosteroid isomerase-like protein
MRDATMNLQRHLAMLLLSCSPLALAAEPTPAAAKPSMSADECAVWARERSFAASVEAHDADAFRAHLHADAAFIDGRGDVTRGAAKVAESWDGIIAGEAMVLRWHPEAVTIAGEPPIALSRGPYWIEVQKPDAAPEYMVGQFISTWVRGKDGQWQVLFDGGGGNRPQPATAEEVAQLKAGLAKSCP